MVLLLYYITRIWLYDYIIIIIYYIFIFEKGWVVSRSPRGRNLNFRAVFFKKTNIFTAYSTVPASGASRRDPPRHGDFGAQILDKTGLM